ncbi:lytic transglycosylase domain-containing protein [Oceanimonas sp. CHS3-5]|uniref:lytic transglycosylase domain-containing protein n=1 Tax=Oceanimonas sp. CHS3-5 TaxID=3068186 RepID=UPI00273EE938|nr:lytic transglycosylase domain-containing protein [Oceanimonas sp. CHS3-5]MDP5292369.1 lytic transglycosylase domain-containing protein [Oceanimonas sp. CHS3-5]
MKILFPLFALWLWATPASAFSFDEGLYAHPAVKKELDYLRRHPAYLERSRARAEAWLPHLLPLLRAHRLPARLAWLPVVESAYLPGALSPAGAAGLWQLMPATAERFGILVNDDYDGRLAPLSASRAALTYLAWLHDYFDGDWLLALAAYNAGEGRVRRAMKRSGSRNFWQLPLPAETRRYVPRFLAVQKLLGPPRASRPSLTEHKVKGPLSLSTLAHRLGVTVKELKAQNLALKGNSVPAEREVSILVGHTGQHRAQRLVPINAQPLFTTQAAGLDLSGAGGLFGEVGAVFSQDAPPGWRPY